MSLRKDLSMELDSFDWKSTIDSSLFAGLVAFS